MIDQDKAQTSISTPAAVFRPPRGRPSVHLDALRGFAAVSVLLYHWKCALFLSPEDLHQKPLVRAAYFVCGLGHQWVVVFFVMSGYLVGGSVLRLVASGRWSWRSYLLARGTRLYIVLLPALLLGGAFDWWGMHLAGTEVVYAGHTGLNSLAKNVHTTLNMPTLAANVLFLQTIHLPGLHGQSVSVFGTNGPLWSLSNEFWYYIAFPLLVLLLAKGRSLRERTACFLGLVGWAWFVGPTIALLGITWLMGMLISFLPPLRASRRLTRGLLIAAAVVIFGGALALGYSRGDSLTNNLVLGLSVTLLIWVILHCANMPPPAYYVNIAQRSARSSYTMYLAHFPLLVFLKASLHLRTAVPGWHTLLVGSGILLVILLYSQLVYEIFEKHTDRIRSWIKPYVMNSKEACGPKSCTEQPTASDTLSLQQHIDPSVHISH